MASMQAHELPRRPPAPGTFDQRVILHGVTWEQYEAVLAMRGDGAGVRVAFLEGELELMSPSRDHETIKKCIARLVEAYAEERGLRLDGLGSMTIRSRPKERGVEPDECWRVGSLMRDGEIPDIVLEVIYASPILDKLHVYDGLAIPEVWLWKDGAFELHRRRDAGGYDRVERSALLPQLDFALVGRFVTREDQDVALREFADAVL